MIVQVAFRGLSCRFFQGVRRTKLSLWNPLLAGMMIWQPFCDLSICVMPPTMTKVSREPSSMMVHRLESMFLNVSLSPWNNYDLSISIKTPAEYNVWANDTRALCCFGLQHSQKWNFFPWRPFQFIGCIFYLTKNFQQWIWSLTDAC